MTDQLLIDLDPEDTAARLADEAAQAAAWDALVRCARVSAAEAKSRLCYATPGDDGLAPVWVCPACGLYEPNEWLIGNNHAITARSLEQLDDGTWETPCGYGADWCCALDLTASHAAGGHRLQPRQKLLIALMRPEVRGRFDTQVEETRQHIAATRNTLF